VTAKQATDDAKKSKLEALSGEYDQLAAYIYYAMTLLQFFKNTVTKDSLTSQAKHSHLDDLAKARQALADNPSITRTIVGAFRKVHNLPDPIRPAPSVAAATAGSTP
jgi:hypothetical protein